MPQAEGQMESERTHHHSDFVQNLLQGKTLGGRKRNGRKKRDM